MVFNIFFLSIVTSGLASILVQYVGLKDSLIVAYVAMSLACLFNWIFLKKPITDLTVGLRWSILLFILSEIIFIVAFVEGLVASKLFEPVIQWFSDTYFSSGGIIPNFNINDLERFQDYHLIVFSCVGLHFSAVIIANWVNYATLGATKKDLIIGLVSILTVYLIVRMEGFEELLSIAVSPPIDFPISGVGPIFVAVFTFLTIMPIGVAYQELAKFISCNFFITSKIFFFVFILTLLSKDSELARSFIALFF